jgi:hypothetical protein
MRQLSQAGQAVRWKHLQFALQGGLQRIDECHGRRPGQRKLRADAEWAWINTA